MERRAVMVGGGVLLASRGVGRAAGPEVVVGSVYPVGDGVTTAVQQFADKAQELARGKFAVAHHSSGALGLERELALGVQRGTLDLAAIATAELASIVPELSVFELPFLFRDYLHLFGATDDGGPLRAYCIRALAFKGFALVALIGAGYHAIAGPAPINAPADLRGRKVRVPDERDGRASAIFAALGATPLAIPLPEIRAALRSKAVDLAQGRLADFIRQKVYEVVTNVTDLRHAHRVVALVGSRRLWARLDGPGRKAVIDAGRFAEVANRKALITEDNAHKEQLRGKSVTLTKPEPTAFREATTRLAYEPFYAGAAGREGRAVVAAALALR